MSNYLAIATVTARGTTVWYTILAPKRGRAIAAVSGLYLDDGFVDELHLGDDLWLASCGQAGWASGLAR